MNRSRAICSVLATAPAPRLISVSFWKLNYLTQLSCDIDWLIKKQSTNQVWLRGVMIRSQLPNYWVVQIKMSLIFWINWPWWTQNTEECRLDGGLAGGNSITNIKKPSVVWSHPKYSQPKFSTAPKVLPVFCWGDHCSCITVESSGAPVPCNDFHRALQLLRPTCGRYQYARTKTAGRDGVQVQLSSSSQHPTLNMAEQNNQRVIDRPAIDMKR